jgi:4'-phosphopantetheinyl transferase
MMTRHHERLPWAIERHASIDLLEPVAEPRLAAGEVHLWCTAWDELSDPALQTAYQALLTADERERRARFYFEKDRLQFLVTRALVRTVLSRYAPRAPADWRFERNTHGRPYVVDPPEGTPYFNLSNAHGMVVCAVTCTSDEIGVDVEDETRMTRPVEIADRFFAEPEVAALRAQPPELQRARFFAYWTLKESYIKARGMGLAIPLGRFWFELDRGPDIGIGLDPSLGDDPAGWRFALLRATPRHPVAVGVRSRTAPLVIRASRCVPLRS